jgi:hypothetical protein
MSVNLDSVPCRWGILHRVWPIHCGPVKKHELLCPDCRGERGSLLFAIEHCAPRRANGPAGIGFRYGVAPLLHAALLFCAPQNGDGPHRVPVWRDQPERMVMRMECGYRVYPRRMPSNEQKDEQPVPSYRAMLVGNRTEFIDFSSDRCAPFHDEPGNFQELDPTD